MLRPKLHIDQMYRLIFLLLITFSCRINKELAFDPFTYNAQTYEKVRLHYNIEGHGDTTLFFIHGWNLDHTYWENQISYFSPSYKLVLLDLAGHGESGKDRRNWTIESFARDITSIIKKEHLEKVILIAHSMGGEIALEVAATLPQKIMGIIGIDNLKNVGMTITEDQRKGMQPYIKKFISNYPTIAEKMAIENIKIKDSTITNRIVRSYINADPRIAVPVLLNLFPKAAEAKIKLTNLPFAMKFIMCSYSPFDEQAFRTYCKKGYEIILIDSSGHFPMIEQPIKFNKALKKLLIQK